MNLDAIIKAGSVVAAIGAIGGIYSYLDQTYARAVDVKEQFQQVNEQLQQSRLDGLYRDEAECNKLKAKLKKGEDESGLCKRVRKQIEKLDPKK